MFLILKKRGKCLLVFVGAKYKSGVTVFLLIQVV